MGLLDKNITKMQGMASRRLEKETTKLNKQLKGFEENVVDRLNWVMKAQQKICDYLKIELDDPLED